jgi:phosphoglycerate dehydrogenase-like enzyme
MKLVIHDAHPENYLDILRRRLPDVAIAYCRDYASLPATLERERPDVLYTVRFAGTPAFPRVAILGALDMRWVSVGGSGTDHLSPWDPARLTVTNAAGVGAETMAQYVFGAMLHFSLGLDRFARDQRAGVWSSGRVSSIRGKVLAIVGLGKTGRAAAALGKALGLEVIGIRARPAATPNVDRVEPAMHLHDVLGAADFILICLPLTPQTRGLIDEAALRSMRRGAVLIDVSRGGIVRQDALIEALRAGHLAGAALDVFETEPLPRDNPFWRMENVILTPHCSSVYEGWERRSIEMFCDNVDRWRRGEPLDNIVDPARGY